MNRQQQDDDRPVTPAEVRAWAARNIAEVREMRAEIRDERQARAVAARRRQEAAGDMLAALAGAPVRGFRGGVRTSQGGGDEGWRRVAADLALAAGLDGGAASDMASRHGMERLRAGLPA